MREIKITEKERRGLKALTEAFAEINEASVSLKFEKNSWNENGLYYLRLAKRELAKVLENVNRDMLDSLKEDEKKM